MATGDLVLILVYDDVVPLKTNTSGNSWLRAATLDNWNRASEIICGEGQSALRFAWWLSLVFGCDVSGRLLRPK